MKRPQTTEDTEIVKAVAKALAPKAWEAYGRIGVDNGAQESRRTASIRHAKAAIVAYKRALECNGFEIVPSQMFEDWGRVG